MESLVKGALFSGDKLGRSLKLYRDKLRNALFGHCNAKNAVHTAHRDRIVGDCYEFCGCLFRHIIQEITITGNIGVIEGRINLI